jgi:hypothetical protein
LVDKLTVIIALVMKFHLIVTHNSCHVEIGWQYNKE